MGDYIGREVQRTYRHAERIPPRIRIQALKEEQRQSYLIRPVDYFLKAAACCGRLHSCRSMIWMAKLQTNPRSSFRFPATAHNPVFTRFKKAHPLRICLKRVGGSKRRMPCKIGGMSAGLTLSQRISNIALSQRKCLTKPLRSSYMVPQINLLEAAKDILAYFHDASCGQCTPCRNGIPVLIKSLQPAVKNSKKKKSLSEMRSLAETIQLTSKCSLGQCAPNAYLSILNIVEQNQRINRA